MRSGAARTGSMPGKVAKGGAAPPVFGHRPWSIRLARLVHTASMGAGTILQPGRFFQEQDGSDADHQDRAEQIERVAVGHEERLAPDAAADGDDTVVPDLRRIRAAGALEIMLE